MPTQIHLHSVSDGQQTLSSTVSKTAEAQIRMDVPIGATQTDKVVEVAFPYDGLVSLLLSSDVAMTLETNSGSAPDDTINLAANQPLEWHDDMPYANPFTADVTALYVTNTAVGTLKIRALYDPTP